jgi:ubiquinone/menaquinone biosynthesis C-methylase UbiE
MNEKTYTGTADRLRRNERVEMLEIDRVVELIFDKAGIASVLDVGTGSGLFAETFCKANKTTAGIDISDNMIAAAKRFAPDADFKIGNADAIPFDAKSFDLLFFGHVLHESSDIQVTLAEAFRVARKRIAILEWPYVEEEIGPPLAHRLKPENLISCAKQLGMTQINTIQLKHMILYIIDF